MCGLCKLNAAALDTTVACGYNGIDQHNLGLLPPIAGIDTAVRILRSMPSTIAPIAGIDSMPRAVSCSTAAPLPHSSIHLPHPLFAFPSPLSIQVRRLLRFENDYKNIFDLTVAPSRKNDIMYMNEKINAFCMRFGSEGRKT